MPFCPGLQPVRKPPPGHLRLKFVDKLCPDPRRVVKVCQGNPMRAAVYRYPRSARLASDVRTGWIGV